MPVVLMHTALFCIHKTLSSNSLLRVNLIDQTEVQHNWLYKSEVENLFLALLEIMIEP